MQKHILSKSWKWLIQTEGRWGRPGTVAWSSGMVLLWARSWAFTWVPFATKGSLTRKKYIQIRSEGFRPLPRQRVLESHLKVTIKNPNRARNSTSVESEWSQYTNLKLFLPDIHLVKIHEITCKELLQRMILHLLVESISISVAPSAFHKLLS